MAFISCFSTVGADASNLPTIRLTPRFQIRFVMVVASIDFFKTLTTCGCLFFSILFFIVSISTLDIAISNAIKRVVNNETGIRLSLTGSYSPN